MYSSTHQQFTQNSQTLTLVNNALADLFTIWKKGEAARRRSCSSCADKAVSAQETNKNCLQKWLSTKEEEQSKTEAKT